MKLKTLKAKAGSLMKEDAGEEEEGEGVVEQKEKEEGGAVGVVGEARSGRKESMSLPLGLWLS